VVRILVDWIQILVGSNSSSASQRQCLVNTIFLSLVVYSTSRFHPSVPFVRYHKSLVAIAVLKQGSANGFIDQLSSVPCASQDFLAITKLYSFEMFRL
jgi:hypothetical protein